MCTAIRYKGAGSGESNDKVIDQALNMLSKCKDRMREETFQQESLLGALRTANEVFTSARFVRTHLPHLTSSRLRIPAGSRTRT